MRGSAAGWLVAVLLGCAVAAVTAQQSGLSSSCPDGSACSIGVFCLRGERRLKRPCRLANGAVGLCCTQQLTAGETAKVVANACIPEPDCSGESRYRTADGSCTSERDPRLGMSNTAYTRLLPAAYIDGEWSQPIKQTQPRDVSRLVFADGDRPHPYLALTTSHWGQLLAHDLTLSSPQTMQDGADIGCCRSDGSATADIPPEHAQDCSLRIGVRNSDPFYRPSVHCLNFVRAQIARPNCYNYGADRSSVIRQVNQATHYLDASMVYGSTAEMQRKVRSGTGGRLATLHEHGKDFLPLGDDKDCAADAGGCFVAGDPRNNVVPALAALHTLLMREHNRIADRLAESNPTWDDETVFQEARMIVIAEVQHITYNEWLPGIVGPRAMEIVNRYVRALAGSRNPPAKDYNPAVSGEFAAAAFRFGHSTVDGRMNLRVRRDSRPESLRLSEFFHRSGRLREDRFLDRVLRWMVETPMQQVDRFVTTSLRGLLDNTTVLPGLPFGDDLVSFNIQRGRDVGLRRYIDYRFWFGMSPVNDWEDLEGVMDPEIIELLSTAYERPGDVDLYVGGILENHAPGAAVGPTFQTILMEQFARTLMGDRDFYIHSAKLSPAQIREIRKATLSRLICDNADSIPQVPRNSFRIPDEENNPVLPCEQIPSVNLNVFNNQ